MAMEPPTEDEIEAMAKAEDRKPKREKPTTTKSNFHHVSLPWNEVIIKGRIFGTPEQNQPGQKDRVKCRVSISTGKDQEGNYNPSIWLNVVMWSTAAEHAKGELTDGMYVKFYGRLSQWKTTNGATVTDIVADWYEVQG